ncbi:MAG: nucleotidyltransferase family protein [Candidatus Korobacteraceae bacterium]
MSDSGSITKCVILARGLGTRMREGDSTARLDAAQSASADMGLKAMVPVGRPFLDYVLSALADAGFEQACLVIGPEHSVIREHYTGANRPKRIQISFAEQLKPRGTADAVLAADEFAGANEFAVINSDNYYPVEPLHVLRDLGQPGAVLFEAASLVRDSNIPPDRIQAFAYCIVDDDGFLADIVEKPRDTSALNFDGEKLVSMNCWRFSPAIFQICRDVPPSSRGEFELPMAVKLAIAHGLKFKVAVSPAGVLDLSRRSDIAAVTERLKCVRVEL